jgi:hypothetical protein
VGGRVCPKNIQQKLPIPVIVKQLTCDWDHKPKIRARFGMGDGEDSFYSDIPGTEYRIYYDIWSNIHYGYVGVQATISDDTLIAGQSLPIAGKTDAGDILTVTMGIKLGHQTPPDRLLPDDIDYAIRGNLTGLFQTGKVRFRK